MKKKYIEPNCDIFLTIKQDVLESSNYNSQFLYDDSDWL